MKGRFTKAGADYDYDPRANDINKGKIQTWANDNQAQLWYPNKENKKMVAIIYMMIIIIMVPWFFGLCFAKGVL